MDKLEITARVERRTWYVNGKYLGSTAKFEPDSGKTAKELTGDFYGEWQGTRHFDGESILKADMERAIENRRLLLMNHPGSLMGEVIGSPIRLGDWGEYRIVSNAALA
jgi:hypothetical protein